eukprot:3674781-Prymnesium_polylepis.1
MAEGAGAARAEDGSRNRGSRAAKVAGGRPSARGSSGRRRRWGRGGRRRVRRSRGAPWAVD